MDKYELNLKLDQMKSLCTVGDFQAAAEVADSVNWSRVRNANALVKVGEIYEKAGRLEDCKELYLLAYDKAPIGRKIIYRLAEIALKMEDYDLAKEYYDEFVEIAPNDNLKFALQYKIRKHQGAGYRELISILEEYQQNEYVEEWAYELARLYHLAGYKEKCVAACDELILWFGNGAFVEKALELKILYQPLTKEQERKYRAYRLKKAAPKHLEEEKDEQEDGQEESDIKLPEVEAPPEKFNTSNLQKEIAEGIQQIIDAKEESSVSDTLENLKRITEHIPYLQSLPEEENNTNSVERLDKAKKPNINGMLGEDEDGQIRMIADEDAQEKQITGQMTLQDLLDDWDRKKKAAELAIKQSEEKKLEDTRAKALQEAEGLMERLNEVIPKIAAGYTTRQIMDSLYLGEEQIEEPKKADNPQKIEEINDIAESQASEVTEGAEESEAAEVIEEPEVSEAAEVTEGAEESEAIEGMEEPEAGEAAEGMEEPEVSEAAEVMEEPEASEAAEVMEEPEAGEAAEVMEKPKESEEDDFVAFDKKIDAYDRLFNDVNSDDELDESFDDDIDSDADDLDDAFDDETDSNDDSDDTFDDEADDTFDDEIDSDDDADDTFDDEEIDSDDELDDDADDMFDDDNFGSEEELDDNNDESDVEINDDEDIEEAETVGDQTVRKPAHIKRLTNEMKSAFSYFVPIKGMEPQLCQAINVITDRLTIDSRMNGGNLIIQGDPGCGKTVLAASFIKVLQDHCGCPSGKVGHIDGEALNRKNIQQLFGRIAGGCLIVENAGKIDRNTAASMAYMMESDGTGILVILEDDENGVNKVMSLDDNFAKKFGCKVVVPIFSNDELVAFARSYARELGYKIDDMAILALHNRISNIERMDQATTLAEVKDIVDDAIDKESHFGVYKYFSLVTGKRYTKDDKILLTERHFS